MILLIDNYDSFTFNLVHYLMELGQEVEVVRNDALTVPQIKSKNPNAVVISPGPGEPKNAGICIDLIKNSGDLPIFGVCLGHQSIGEAFGGRIVRGEKPMHGKVSEVVHQGQGIFKDIPSPFKAARYHSLVIEKSSLPAELEVTAETAEGVIMAVSHRTKNIHGVQFHPESIASQYGHKIIQNFLNHV